MVTSEANIAMSDLSHKPHLTRFRVLIADDVMETRRSTRLMVAQIPFLEVVAIAHNGRQAVEMTKAKKPDIALMDVNMPGIDGLSAIEMILKQQPGIACIVVSAEREQETLQRAMAIGARDYLVKPFTLDQLTKAVTRAGQFIMSNREQLVKQARMRQQREAQLKQLANEYSKTGRTDAKAVAVFEELAKNPDCDIRWLKTLGVIYLFRNQWDRLKLLVERMERRGSNR
jgi:YesN/AraC family two-component response regulator